MATTPEGALRNAAIVGGGISGLCAAYEFQKAGVAVDVYEAAAAWGGKIQTSLVGERLVDAGPDTFLARAPEGVQLCRELGIDHELVSPVAKVPAYIHLQGRLHGLPAGTVLGIPTDFEAVRRSGLVSNAGIRRAEEDLTRSATSYDGDCSLGWYCRQRLGEEVTDRLIDPLLGGINASNIDELSLEAGFPALAGVAKSEASLLRGLHNHRASIGATLGSAKGGKAAPVFFSLPRGMASLVDRLVQHLSTARPGEPAVQLHANHTVDQIDSLDADMVVLATPAPAAARLVNNPAAARLLKQIDYTTVSQVTFAFGPTAVQPALDASGILFPGVDGLLATAATWLSSKWEHYAQGNQTLIRVSAGRANDLRASTMNNDELAQQLLLDLQTVVSVLEPPQATRVQRWPEAFPKYTPGHMRRRQQIESELRATNVRVAGAAYEGIGIPACIASGRSAAVDLLETEQD